MKKLQHPLIANRSAKQLSALGYKQMYRIVEKAAKANNTHPMARDFKPMKVQVINLVMSLIFDHNITKEQLSDLQRNIKVTNGQLQLPSIATINHGKNI